MEKKMRKTKSWIELKEENNRNKIYRIIDNNSYSNNIAVKKKIVSDVFTIEFTEEQCMIFENIFKDYLHFHPPEYNKLEDKLKQSSKDFYNITNYPALQCILYCSKIIPVKKFDRKLVEVLSNVIEHISKYIDYNEFEKQIIHIINHWSNWIPQLKVAIRVAYKIDDIEFLKKIYDDYIERDEFYWEVFYMILRSGKKDFIPLIFKQVIEARSTTEKDAQIRNLFKNNFRNYYSVSDARNIYYEMQERDSWIGGYGQRAIESVINEEHIENDLILKIKEVDDNKKKIILVRLLESLENERQAYDKFYNIYNAMKYINDELKIEVLKWMVSYLSKLNLDESFNKGIAREMIFRLAFNNHLYQDPNGMIDDKYGKINYFVGAVDVYNLYIGKTTYEVFTRNFLIEHNNEKINSYINAILKLTKNTSMLRNFNRNIVTHLNSYLKDSFSDNKNDEYYIKSNISVALINLKKLIAKDKRFFVREMRSIFEKFFGFESDPVIELSPIISNDSMENILSIIDSVYVNRNDRGFNDLLFKIRDSNISQKLTNLSRYILRNKGGIGLPTNLHQADFLYNEKND